MARMTAARAAVEILKREGVTAAFGVPGAAINPFYAALKASGGIQHTLARHVEGASHMAEGYTRTHPGNIGVCIGTSGPAGTDMITGLYSALGDSVPILCITGQAPTAVIHKEDFQAVDIASIATPVTKMAVTVLEAAQVPGVFQQAFHLMRSGRRPGPACPATGIRSTVPQGHPSSGRGHWPRRSQAAQRRVIHSSSHTRWTTAAGAVRRSSTGTTGAPHAHG